MPRGRPQKYATDSERLAAIHTNNQRYKQKRKANLTSLTNLLPDAANNMLNSLGVRAEDLDILAGLNLAYISKLKFKANINYYRTYES